MSLKFRVTILTVVISLIGFVTLASAQQAPAAAPQQQEQTAAPSAMQPPASAPAASVAQPEQAAQAASSPESAKEKEAKEAAAEQAETNAFKFSPSVKWFASKTGLTPEAMSSVAFILNFAIVALLIALLLKKNLPATFRARTESIRKGIDEAQRASADANRRLADVETRLSRLDQEIAGMHAAAEKEAAAEEARIVAAAEEDKKKIVESVESEIVAAARIARRELKAFAAELAVSMAERRIHVDPSTDQALVRSFTDQLGSNGKDGH